MQERQARLSLAQRRNQRALPHVWGMPCSLNLLAVGPKETVQRFVDEAVNGGRAELIEELFTPEMAEPSRGTGSEASDARFRISR